MREWNQFLSKLDLEFGSKNVDHWLRSLKLIRFDAENIYFQAKDTFQLQWFNEYIKPKLSSFKNANDRLIRVHIYLPDMKKHASHQNSEKKNLYIQPSPLFDEYQFETFIPTEKNELPYRFFKTLANEGMTTFNPVYLYGIKGVGKTHLLISLANLLKKRGKRVFYVQAEAFASHVVQAIRMAKMQEFRNIYRNIDVLMIDNIQNFSRKNATQEEFFHTFNTLHTQNNLIILSANVSPRELTEIEPRLVSRFEWGITFMLEKPKTNEMIEILKQKAKFMNFSLSDSLIEYLTNTFYSSHQSLYQAFDALVLKSHMQNQKNLSLTEVKTILSPLMNEETIHRLTPEKIVKTTALHFGLKSEDLLGKSQQKEMSFPRKIAIFLCRKMLKIPFMKIGEIFQRDHSTIMSSSRQIEKSLKEKKKDTQIAVSAITKKLETQETNSWA